jgi:hypothetical protein
MTKLAVALTCLLMLAFWLAAVATPAFGDSLAVPDTRPTVAKPDHRGDLADLAPLPGPYSPTPSISPSPSGDSPAADPDDDAWVPVATGVAGVTVGFVAGVSLLALVRIGRRRRAREAGAEDRGAGGADPGGDGR